MKFFQHMPFLRQAHHSLLELRNTRQHSSTTLGATSNGEITNEKLKNVKRMALNRPCKGHPFTVGELRQEGKATTGLTTAGNVLGD